MKCKECRQEVSEPTKTMRIKELNIEVEKEIHNKNETLAQAMKSCPKGWRLPTYTELQWLRNSKYCKKLNLVDTWEFVEQPDEISKKIGYVAWFYAYSDLAGLDCYRDPHVSGSSLGVRFVRKIK